MIISAVPCFAQNDSGQTYNGFEFDLTANIMKKKLIASSNKTINYYDTIEYSEISSILLLKDTIKFINYGKEMKLNLSEVSELSFRSGSYSALGVFIGIAAGFFLGGMMGYAVDPPNRNQFMDMGGGPLGALIGMICGGITGGIVAPSSYDNYYLYKKDNNERRTEMIKILNNAKVMYRNDL